MAGIGRGRQKKQQHRERKEVDTLSKGFFGKECVFVNEVGKGGKAVRAYGWLMDGNENGSRKQGCS